MIERVLAQLTVSYRGVPIGNAPLLERRLSHEDIQRILQQEFPPPVDREPHVLVFGFEPLPGYESVASIIHLAALANHNLGYLGPAADPKSKIAGDEAWAAREAFVAELELHCEDGQLFPADIGMLDEWTWSSGERRFFFEAQVVAAAAGVVAALRQRDVRDSGAEPDSA